MTKRALPNTSDDDTPQYQDRQEGHYKRHHYSHPWACGNQGYHGNSIRVSTWWVGGACEAAGSVRWYAEEGVVRGQEANPSHWEWVGFRDFPDDLWGRGIRGCGQKRPTLREGL